MNLAYLHFSSVIEGLRLSNRGSHAGRSLQEYFRQLQAVKFRRGSLAEHVARRMAAALQFDPGIFIQVLR